MKIGSREPGFPVFGQNFNLDFDPLPVIFRNEHIRPKVLSRRDLSIGVSNSKLLNFSYLEKKLNLVHFSLLLTQLGVGGFWDEKNFFSQKWFFFIKPYSVGQGLSNGTTFSQFGVGRCWGQFQLGVSGFWDKFFFSLRFS